MNNNEINILWTNDNVDTSLHMVLMYSKASMVRGFWEKVNVIIWGATAKLVAENKEIQKSLLEAKAVGVNFVGCLACAQNLDVVDELEALDIELKLMGNPLTEIIKNGQHLITI